MSEFILLSDEKAWIEDYLDEFVANNPAQLSAAISRARTLWGTFAVERVPAPSPWHDASETPRSYELCVVEWRHLDGTVYYYVHYYDKATKIWREQDGHGCMGAPLRYLYLDTGGTAPTGKVR